MPLRSWICHVSAWVTAVSNRWSPWPIRARDSAGVKPSGGYVMRSGACVAPTAP